MTTSCVLIAICTLVATAACGTASAAGPLHSLSQAGQRVVDVDADPVYPGQTTDFTAFLVNPLSSPVTLVSAVAVPIPGVPPAHLAHVAVDTSVNIDGVNRGWPPGLPIKPIAGARIGPGQTNIVAGVTGSVPGHNYAVAGLRVTYRYEGHTYSVVAWSGAIACVVKVLRDTKSCVRLNNTVMSKVQQLADADS